MTQLLEIISVLSNSNPTAIMSSQDHERLVAEFERAKESETGWQECGQLLLLESSSSSPHHHNLSDQAKFFCMQVIENFLKTRYAASSQEQSSPHLRQFMTMWLQQQQQQRKANEKSSFLTKKSAQLFALVSLIDFPARWPTFFHDLIATAQWSLGNADFYLKVLLAIDSEIVDRELPRSAQEAHAISSYKDAIRERCVQDLVDSWYMLLKEHKSSGGGEMSITCQCLQVIGIYVDWIDINLIVNERFLDFFVFGLSQADLRETACGCVEEIVNKRMEPRAKLRLVDYLWVNVLERYAQQLDSQIHSTEDNCDYLLKFGKLLAAIGDNLFDATKNNNNNNKKDSDMELYEMQVKCLEQKIPYVLSLLNHTDDDICESVAEYCMYYIAILSRGNHNNKILTLEQRTSIENMFTIVVNKMRFDVSSFNFESEGEDEAMFLEFRKSIKSVFDSLAQLDCDFVLDACTKLVMSVSANWQTHSFDHVENALHLLYLIAEALPSTQGNHFSPRSPKSEALCSMLHATITSNIVTNPYRIVKLQYFENITRYYRYFQITPHLVESTIDHFIGIHGLHSPDPKLRSRVSYLFSRFTKDLKHLLSPFIEKILNSIQDLLKISNSNNNNDTDDQLFLYETCSILIVSSNLDAKTKAQLMKSLLAPVVGCFSLLVEKYLHTSDQAHLDVLAQSLNTAMLVASRVSKGFSLQVKLKDCDSVDIFLEILRIFMPCVNICAHKTLIQAAFRQYLHRMLVCLDAEIIDYLPLTIGALLIKYNNNNSSQQITCEQPKDLADLIPLLNQCINKLKVQAVPFVESILMILINLTLQFLNLLPSDVASNLFKSPHLLPIKSLHSTLIVNNNNNNSKNLLNLNPINTNNNTESTSLILNSPSIVIIIDPQFVLDTQFLYKSCVQFLLNVANNDLMEIVANQAPDDIYKIFSFLLQAAQIGTQDVAKICFQAIKKYILALADKPNQIPNFIQYLMENVVPCCIQLLIRPSVDLNDAQHIFAFNEIANCLIYLYTKFGADFINYLEFNILPQLQLSQQFNQILIELIKTNNVKGFKVLREHIKGQAQS